MNSFWLIQNILFAQKCAQDLQSQFNYYTKLYINCIRISVCMLYSCPLNKYRNQNLYFQKGFFWITEISHTMFNISVKKILTILYIRTAVGFTPAR